MSQQTSPDPDTKTPAIEDAPLVFLDAEEPASAAPLKTWKVLIADDDEEVHLITQMVLRDLVFEGRPLQLLSAHTGADALRMLGEHPDTAIILLDVVMESEHAGLEAARTIRETLGNRFVRIILRTGQPGQAPEKKVIVNYDINDYKEKTELTSQRLVTTVIAALRSYRDIVTIDRSRQGLIKIIEASRDIFGTQSLTQLSSAVLLQISALLHLGNDAMLARTSGLTAKLDPSGGENNYTVIAGTGRFSTASGQPLSNVLGSAEIEQLMQTPLDQAIVRIGEFLGHFSTTSGAESVVMVQMEDEQNEVDVDLLKLFATNIGVAFDNAALDEELLATQSEMVHTLSKVVEARSSETGQHVVRVGELSCLLAKLAGLDESDINLLRLAAPMHDLGKIGIPDLVLHKQGTFTPEEWAMMRQHSTIGHNLLFRSQRPVLKAAAILAFQHHECWDGSGYPNGLKGEEIHIFGRIVALVDVFDALSHARCYKEAWPMPTILDFIRKGSGCKFDPDLVDIFLAHADEFIELWNQYSDH
ncbi:DUF3369 domain-containing protein [Propionivibrio sp.]|uniref:DUF3369 domain-containing protein n=1 Tax=Propionivibrio sp. TaxID=2212460 RepID=UPI003BF2222E